MQQNKTASQRKLLTRLAGCLPLILQWDFPFIAINLVSVFMFKDLGISDTQIAFWTSLIMMPWTLKFLWSPFLEMYRTKKILRINNRIVEWCIVWSSSFFFVLRLFFRYKYLYDGSDSF